MKTVEGIVTYKYQLQIDESSPVVQDYENEGIMLIDCAGHQFSENLPVVSRQGVVVLDREALEVSKPIKK